MRQPNYYIGTGWWCPVDRKHDGRAHFHGDDFIRSEKFHHIWYETLMNVSSPERIVMVDSASPITPPLDERDTRIVTLKLSHNPGHASNHVGHYGGWMASVLLSLEYAICSDAEYYVYVEQDLLLHGRGIIEHCISKMRTPFMFGNGRGTPQPIQQSLFIIRRDGMRSFLAGLHRLRQRDFELHPEWKFVLAALPSYFSYLAPVVACYKDSQAMGGLRAVLRHVNTFDWLPVGYGRVRPIHFNEPYFYFQHGTADEVRQYLTQLPDELLSRISVKCPDLDIHNRGY